MHPECIAMHQLDIENQTFNELLYNFGSVCIFSAYLAKSCPYTCFQNQQRNLLSLYFQSLWRYCDDPL